MVHDKGGIVVADQPMTHSVFSFEEQNSIILALTEFMLDLRAPMGRDDYEIRHKPQVRGGAKAKGGRYHHVNESLYQEIRDQLILGGS